MRLARLPTIYSQVWSSNRKESRILPPSTSTMCVPITTFPSSGTSRVLSSSSILRGSLTVNRSLVTSNLPLTSHKSLTCVHCVPPVYMPPHFHQSRRQITKSAELPVAPNISLLSIKRFLRIKSLDFQETHPCLLVSLPRFLFSQEATVTTSWSGLDDALVTLFINKVTGGFVIPELALSGNWIEFEWLVTAWSKNRSLKRTDPQRVEVPSLKQVVLGLTPHQREVWDRAVPVEQIDQAQFREILKHLGQIKRDFDVEDFAHFGVRVDPVSLDKLYFPVKYINGVLVGLRQVCVIDNQLDEQNVGDVEDQETGLLPFIHNIEAVTNIGSSHCVIVGSVLDSVVLSSRTREQVIVLPELLSLHPNLLPFLNQFSCITLWLGAEMQGTEAARGFAKKIGEERCRIVNNQYPSALSAVRKKMNVQQIVSSAKALHHEFITTFDSLRHDVYLEFLQSEELEGVKWKRFEGLNSLLKGFRRGEMTIFTGRTGSGKTTFMSEYSLDLCMQGVNTLWGSFEVKNVRLIRMMMKQFSLINIDENLYQFEKVADKFQKLPLYFTTFHGAEDVEKVLDAMSHAVYVHDIAHIIIDNIQFMIGMAGGSLDRFQQQDLCIEKFRKFATLHNCHVTLVIHPRKEAEDNLTVHSIFGGGKATQEADNVLLLQDESSPQSFVKKKSIEVAKNRYAGDLGQVSLSFTKPVLCLSKKVADQVRKTSKKKTLRLVDQEGGGPAVIREEVLVEPEDSGQ